jgi:hypothetical protein
MPGPFDDTLKHLTELSPDDWVVRVPIRPGSPTEPPTETGADGE